MLFFSLSPSLDLRIPLLVLDSRVKLVGIQNPPETSHCSPGSCSGKRPSPLHPITFFFFWLPGGGSECFSFWSGSLFVPLSLNNPLHRSPALPSSNFRVTVVVNIADSLETGSGPKRGAPGWSLAFRGVASISRLLVEESRRCR